MITTEYCSSVGSPASCIPPTRAGRVRLVRGEGRGVSTWYEGGGAGGGGGLSAGQGRARVRVTLQTAVERGGGGGFLAQKQPLSEKEDLCALRAGGLEADLVRNLWAPPGGGLGDRGSGQGGPGLSTRRGAQTLFGRSRDVKPAWNAASQASPITTFNGMRPLRRAGEWKRPPASRTR